MYIVLRDEYMYFDNRDLGYKCIVIFDMNIIMMMLI